MGISSEITIRGEKNRTPKICSFEHSLSPACFAAVPLRAAARIEQQDMEGTSGDILLIYIYI